VRRRRGPALVAGLALVAMLMVAGCGSTSLSAQQLHTRAQRVCRTTARRLDGIPTPQLPTAGATFLTRGIAALRPELVALKRLRPDGDLAKPFGQAIDATEKELAALESTVKGLKTGNDPVVAIKTLQQQLLPLEQRAVAAWTAVGVPSCAAT
jgi:hypothetical protein